MATPITEYFNGGINTAQHPALLAPGELQRADDCVVRDSSIAVHRAPGRTPFNASPLSSGIKGLAALTFDQSTDQLLAWPAGDGTTSYLYKSDFTGITGAFTILTGPGIVTNCTITLTTTVTAAAGSFANMIAGTRVTGTGVPSGTYVDTVNSDTVLTLSQASTNAAGLTLAFDAGIAAGMEDVGDETLDTIQWEDTYFILPRRGTVNRVYWKSFAGPVSSQSLIMRPAGLLPITQAPTITVQAGAGWSSVLGNGYYWFLLTEILSSDDAKMPDVESGYIADEGRAVVVNITTNATQFVRVTFPTIKNDGLNGTNRSTHWGIYMSIIGPGQAAYPDNSNMPSAATFRRIQKVDISETSKDIKFNNTSQGPSLPTTSAAVGALGQFTNPSGVFARGGTFASTVTTLAKANAFAGFGFSTGAPYNGYTVTGIKINVIAKSGSLVQLPGYSVWLDNNGAKISNRMNGLGGTTTFNVRPFGGQSENWGVAWVPADIGNLRVMIQKTATNQSVALYIDYIEVVVYYSGAALDTGSVNLDGVPYQVVTYRSQIGTTVNDPANYIIPTASTGDIFQGSLVLNDINSPGSLRYSIAGVPESFPKPYEMKFRSKKKDIVTFIRKVGQVLVVGMRDSVKRVNYLPTEVDVDFGRGIAHEDIVTEHGIVGPRAGCLVDIPSVGVVLAYIGHNGFYLTDGISDRLLNTGIDIETLVKASALSSCVLRVYPREKWIVFYYCPFGATHTKNTKAIIFSYSQNHVKNDGTLPGYGPITISARAVAEGNIAGTTYLLTGHQTSGVVYVEDSGVVQASGYQVHSSVDVLAAAPIIPLIKTRKIFAAGVTREAREQRLYLLHDALGTSYTINSTTTISSLIVTSINLFANVAIGMFVTGTGIPVNTIVKAKLSNSSITLSNAATVSGTNDLVFDDGTIATTIRGSGIDNDVYEMDTFYATTRVGDLLVQGHDNTCQGIEIQIEKVVLPDDTTVDLGQQMRFYQFTLLAEDLGIENNRGS